MLSGILPKPEIFIFKVSPDKPVKSPVNDVNVNGRGGVYSFL